jgi:hypothetical protein
MESRLARIQSLTAFWLECVKTSFGRPHAIASIFAILLSFIATVLSWYVTDWGNTLKLLVGVAPLGILLITMIGFLVVNLVRMPFRLYREQIQKVDEYERSQIALIVEENDVYLQKRGRNWIFRVGVKALGAKTVNNAEVTLNKIDGNLNAYSDAPLRPSYSFMGESGLIKLNPGEIKYIELFSWGNDEINCWTDIEYRIHYHQNYQLGFWGNPSGLQPFILPSGIPVGRRVITIKATGDDVPAVMKEFIVTVDDGVPAILEA